MGFRDLFSKSRDSKDLDKMMQKADANYTTKVAAQSDEGTQTQEQVQKAIKKAHENQTNIGSVYGVKYQAVTAR